jgi:ParB/RepB/Spo0J family partition protein
MARKKLESAEDIMYATLPTVKELEGSMLTLKSPVTGQDISCHVVTLHGDEILSKTKVIEKNQRIQAYLNEDSLAWLVSSLKKSNQVSPALGKLEEDGSISIIYGSRRRYATYLAQVSYTIIVSRDITEEEAEHFTEAENVAEDISLLERGVLWKAIKDNEGLSGREIALKYEDNKVSYRLINDAINAASLEPEIIALYPSLTLISRDNTAKLTKALKEKSAVEILAYVNEHHSDVLASLKNAQRELNDCELKLLSAKLTKMIVNYCFPKEVDSSGKKKIISTNMQWSDSVKVQINKQGVLEHIVLNKELNKKQFEQLKSLLSSF